MPKLWKETEYCGMRPPTPKRLRAGRECACLPVGRDCGIKGLQVALLTWNRGGAAAHVDR